MANEEQVTTNVLTWVLTSLSTVLIALRLWSRIRIKPNFGWDDVAIIVAQVSLSMILHDQTVHRPSVCAAVNQLLTIGFHEFQIANITLAILISMAVASGTGRRMESIAKADLPYAIKINTIANAISIITFTLPKIAIALLLVRILSLSKITVAFFIGLAIFLNLYGCVQIASFLVYAVKQPAITVNTALGEGGQ